MTIIRVLLAVAAPIARAILRAEAAKAPDLELLPDATDLRGLRGALAGSRVDAVIVGLAQDALPPGYGELLARSPELRVLGLSEDGATAFAFGPHLVRRPLGVATAGVLIEALREGGRPGPSHPLTTGTTPVRKTPAR